MHSPSNGRRFAAVFDHAFPGGAAFEVRHISAKTPGGMSGWRTMFWLAPMSSSRSKPDMSTKGIVGVGDHALRSVLVTIVPWVKGFSCWVMGRLIFMAWHPCAADLHAAGSSRF